jgi:Fic family protein
MRRVPRRAKTTPTLPPRKRCATAPPCTAAFSRLKDRPLCTATAVDVCRTLKGVDMDIRRTPGTQLINDRTGEVIYTPPEGEARLRDMLANWERFLHNQTELDPLIRMAVGHYQFEAIHPFTDGNGRTGRVINILYLIQEELLNLPILYLSRHVIAHKADYYGLLLGVTRDQAWEPWLHFMLQAVAETSKWTTGKIAAIRKLAEHTTEHVRDAAAQDLHARTGGRDLRAALLPHRQPGGQGHRPAPGGLTLPA